VIELADVSKHYRTARGRVRALDGVSLSLPAGSFTVLRGASGSGKTTLLLVLGGMLQPTSGRAEVLARDLYALDGRSRARFRAEEVGFVFQMYHLVPYLDVLANVRLGARQQEPQAAAHTRELLEQLGMTERLHHRPSELSAGEKQRVAMARALASRPSLILADEPTGNLDEENTRRIVDQLAAFRDDGGTVVMVMHDDCADTYADRIVHLEAGKLAGAPSSGGES